jgi:hypothetical protein
MNKLYIFIIVFAIFSSCKKEKDLCTFYWIETGCSDPWKQVSGDTEEERKWAIENYLEDQNVNVVKIEFEFDSTKEEFCEACNCLTGRVIIVAVSRADKRKMEKLEFYRN